MTFNKNIPYPKNTTGIHHTPIKKNGKTIGWSTEYITSQKGSPLTLLQIQHYQRRLCEEEHKKDWNELIRDVKEDDLINERIKKQETILKPKKKHVNWQKPLSPWIAIWNKDAELRKLFDNNYRHMRIVAHSKNYNREWVCQLKQEQSQKKD